MYWQFEIKKSKFQLMSSIGSETLNKMMYNEKNFTTG